MKPFTVTVSNHYVVRNPRDPGPSTSTNFEHFGPLEIEAVTQTLEQSPLGVCQRFAELLRSVGTAS